MLGLFATAAERRRRRLDRTLRREARYYGKVLANAAAKLGLSYLKPRSDSPGAAGTLITGKTRREKLRYIDVQYNEQALYFRIDVLDMPYRVSIQDLREDYVIDHLSMACQRRVHLVADEKAGVWFVIDRDDAVRQIPKIFHFSEAMAVLTEHERTRERRLPLLYYIAGVKNRAVVVDGNLVGDLHMLIAGSTGSGKSVMLNQILCTLLLRNSPETLHLYLIDLKFGAELWPYRHLPHVRDIAKSIGAVPRVLRSVMDLVNERGELLQRHDMRDLEQFNAWRVKNGEPPLPYIVLVFDELAQVMLDKQTKPETNALLAGIFALGRAMGVRAIMATQSPDRRIVDGLIKNNVTTLYAFSTGNQHHSMLIIGNGRAYGLEPRGRCIRSIGGRLVELQATYIDSDTINHVIGFVTRRDGANRAPATDDTERYDESPSARFDPAEMLRWALDENGGVLSRRDLIRKFVSQGLISETALVNWLTSLYNDPIEIDGAVYRVKRGAGRAPNKLELLSEGEPLAAD